MLNEDDIRLQVERVLGDALTLDPREARAILEIAYVAIASDHVLAAAEIQAFQAVASALRDKAVFSRRGRAGAEEVDLELIEPEAFELIGQLAREVGTSREALRDAADRLARVEAKEAAYKVAFAMTLADFDTADEEIDLDDALAEMLGIDDATAERFESEVYAILEA